MPISRYMIALSNDTRTKFIGEIDVELYAIWWTYCLKSTGRSYTFLVMNFCYHGLVNRQQNYYRDNCASIAFNPGNTRRWPNASPPSTMLAQYLSNIGSRTFAGGGGGGDGARVMNYYITLTFAIVSWQMCIRLLYGVMDYHVHTFHGHTFEYLPTKYILETYKLN